MPTPPLSLSNIVDITVQVSPSAAAVAQFNVGLFIGPSTVIPSYGANSRVRYYTSTTAMLADGFTVSSPEYIAAQILFSQSQPAFQIGIGRQDLTALGAVAVDGRTVADGDITTGTLVLTSATAAFSAGDVGSTVIIEGAGAAGAALVTTIASYVNATTVDLAVDALTTVVNAQTSIGFTGSGYHVNDLVTVTQGGANYGTVQILTVGISGQVLTVAVTQGGEGYAVANGLSTVAVAPSAGTGFKLNATTIGETPLQAAVACRAASGTWYGLAVNNPSDADNVAISEWADPLWQTVRYYPFSSSVSIPAATAGNVALQVQTLQLRVLGQYATTQSGLYPNNVYAAVALMGCEMGLNTGLAGSFFTIAHKTLVGIAPEPLTQTQYANILAAGFNVYATFQGYQLEEPGFMSNGSPSYLWLNLAMYVAQLQSQEMAVLQDTPAVPQTNAGEQLLLHAANNAGTISAAIGFLAPSTWTGASINVPGVVLANGDPIPSGFLNLAQPYSQQSISDRDAGRAMPIYSFVTTAGAVQSLLIGVNVEL